MKYLNKVPLIDIQDIKSEAEIKKNWFDEIVKVSICCITYNHERYIQDALDGFLKQKTKFAFEVLIHDDASTDRTAEIITEYQQLYPSIIKPILQQENQHSQGIGISLTYNYPRAKGVYIAICEGDDYWTDPLKLQKQVDALNEYSSCNICFHSAQSLNNDGSYLPFCHYSSENKLFTIEEVIEGGGGFMPTASILFRASIIDVLERFYSMKKSYPVGDTILQIIASEKGGALYLSFEGTIYRKCSIGSWTERMQNDRQFSKNTNMRILELYNDLNEFYNKKYKDSFFKVLRFRCLSIFTNPYLDIEERYVIQEQYSAYLNSYPYFFIKTYLLLRIVKKFIKDISRRTI